MKMKNKTSRNDAPVLASELPKREVYRRYKESLGFIRYCAAVTDRTPQEQIHAYLLKEMMRLVVDAYCHLVENRENIRLVRHLPIFIERLEKAAGRFKNTMTPTPDQKWDLTLNGEIIELRPGVKWEDQADEFIRKAGGKKENKPGYSENVYRYMFIRKAGGKREKKSGHSKNVSTFVQYMLRGFYWDCSQIIPCRKPARGRELEDIMAYLKKRCGESPTEWSEALKRNVCKLPAFAPMLEARTPPVIEGSEIGKRTFSKEQTNPRRIDSTPKAQWHAIKYSVKNALSTCAVDRRRRGPGRNHAERPERSGCFDAE